MRMEGWMKLRQLHYFLTVVDEGSFTRAAERLFVAQPSLSQMIKSLETEMGGLLLERLPKGVRLTAAGRAFLPEARAAVVHAAAAARSARSVLGLDSGELEVATVTSIAFGILPAAFRAWRQRYPGTTIALREYTDRNALSDAVRLGVGDIAIGPIPAQWRGPIVELGWEEFVTVLPAADPLAATNRPVELQDLADRDWVLFGPGHGLSTLILDACARAGFTPRSTVQTSQVAAATPLAAAGLGVALVPSNVVPNGTDAAIRRLQPPLVRQLVAYTRQDWPPLADAFLHELQAQPWSARPAVAAVIP
jgi:DNA-binding transcriptional LysR family regulator